MSKNQIQQIIDQFHVVVLDGAMATEIEKKGVDIKNDLWSAEAIIENSAIIKKVHLDYFKAGADIASTNTYQANIEGFIKTGMPKIEAESLITKAVTLARESRDEFWEGLTKEKRVTRPYPLVAGSIGPYGAYLANGSEYTGNYTLTNEEFKNFHLSRMKLLKEAKVDLFAFETIPHFEESKALAELLTSYFPDDYAWLSFSISDELMLCDGTPLEEVVSYFNQYPNICAIGVNCTSISNISPVLEKLNEITTKPIIIYPNSGETYDPNNKTWTHAHQNENFNLLSKKWFTKGARLIGGCCRTSPEDINQIKEWASKENARKQEEIEVNRFFIEGV